MKIVRAYRLGDDGYSVYRVPSPKQSVQQMSDTWGEVYSMVEKCVLKGGIPRPIERINVQQELR